MGMQPARPVPPLRVAGKGREGWLPRTCLDTLASLVNHVSAVAKGALVGVLVAGCGGRKGGRRAEEQMVKAKVLRTVNGRRQPTPVVAADRAGLDAAGAPCRLRRRAQRARALCTGGHWLATDGQPAGPTHRCTPHRRTSCTCRAPGRNRCAGRGRGGGGRARRAGQGAGVCGRGAASSPLFTSSHQGGCGGGIG